MSTPDPVVYNGRYEVQRPIARGGMAEVFLAQDQLLARPVAVKVLFPEFAGDPAFVARFRREAQAAANLNHPNIVGVYDWGQEGGTYYIVMEYVDGKSLSEIIRSEGLPPPDAAAGITADVAAALGFAHQNGVVHRDVKPGNIMITTNGHVKVADFGIARAIHGGAEENLTQTGSVMGTATYFSPEQAQAHDVDPRSDLYSLGVVMYEMATGKPPFTGDSPVSIAYKHVQEAPVPPSRLNPQVPAPYEAITLKLLAKNPDDRYPNADELRRDLRRFTQGEQVLAAPAAVPVPPPPVPMPTPAERREPVVVADQPTTGRRTAWFIAVLLLLLVVLGGLLFAFAQTLGLTKTDDKVTVPGVTTENALTAVATLKKAGFDVDYSRREVSDVVTKDFVISQDPTADTKAPKGSTVTIVISNGPSAPPTMNLPDVTGSNYDDAQQFLDSQGFKNVRRLDQFNDAPENQVFAMSPAGGPSAEYAAEESITLVTSKGPDPASTTTSPPETAPETTQPPETTAPPPTQPPETQPPATTAVPADTEPVPPTSAGG